MKEKRVIKGLSQNGKLAKNLYLGKLETEKFMTLKPSTPQNQTNPKLIFSRIDSTNQQIYDSINLSSSSFKVKNSSLPKSQRTSPCKPKMSSKPSMFLNLEQSTLNLTIKESFLVNESVTTQIENDKNAQNDFYNKIKEIIEKVLSLSNSMEKSETTNIKEGMLNSKELNEIQIKSEILLNLTKSNECQVNNSIMTLNNSVKSSSERRLIVYERLFMICKNNFTEIKQLLSEEPINNSDSLNNQIKENLKKDSQINNENELKCQKIYKIKNEENKNEINRNFQRNRRFEDSGSLEDSVCSESAHVKEIPPSKIKFVKKQSDNDKIITKTFNFDKKRNKSKKNLLFNKLLEETVINLDLTSEEVKSNYKNAKKFLNEFLLKNEKNLKNEHVYEMFKQSFKDVFEIGI